MPATIVVSGVPPYDGEYEFDEDRVFSALEWRWLKRIGGYKPATISEGLDDNDPELICILTVISMHRAGAIQKEQAYDVADVLLEVPFDNAAITLKVDEAELEEEDESPLALTSEPENGSPSGSLEKPLSLSGS